MTLRQQFKDTLKWLWLAIKYKVRYRVFKPYYRKVVKIEEEPFDRRKVDVLVLECGHKYWREKQVGEFQLKPPQHRLCDSCFRTSCIKEFGEIKGAVWFGLWEKIIKGR